MTTQNIISTPAITGNIGSCKTETAQVIERSSLTKDTGYTIVTNSCTGAVEKYSYSSVNGAGIAMGFGIFIVIMTFLIAWGSRESY